MAAIPVRYEAGWIPGFNTDFDPDEAIRLGSAWLASRKSVRSRVVVMNAKKMMDNRPSLRELATRFPFVSPQSRDAGSAPRAVLAVYPTNTTLALAEALALDGALCVIPGTIDDVTSWIARSGATNLAFPEEAPPELPALSDIVRGELDSICRFGGHNEFLGGGEKERAIPGLRRIAAQSDRPSPEDIENYVLGTGDVGADGARRLRKWYEKLLQGRRFKDYRGRYI